MKRSALAFTITTLWTATSLAAEVDNVSISSDLSYGYSSVMEESMQGLLELTPSMDLSFSEASSLAASARIRLDAQDRLEPGRPAFDTYSSASSPVELGTAGAMEIRDLYVELRSENGLARFGKQQIVWGRMDGIKVLDLVNPQDFREFILDDFADSRISLWSAYFDYTIGSWRAEVALVPDGTGHAIPEDGAWFELTAPRFRYGAESGQPGLPVVTVKPGHSFDEAAAGLRLSRQFGSFELSGVAYSGMDPEPLGRIDVRNTEAIVERYYDRRDALGFSIDMGLGSAVVRAEYAYQPERVFNTRLLDQLSTAELDQHRAAIGLDIDGPFGIFVNLQYLVDSISDAPAELVRPDTDRIGTLFLRKTFAYDTITFEARWYHSFTDEDRLASLSIEYTLSDSTSIELAAHAFGGSSEGLFGQFAERDRITLSLSHIF